MSSFSSHTITRSANTPTRKSQSRKHDRSPSPPKALLQPHSVNALRAAVNARLASGTQIINLRGHSNATSAAAGSQQQRSEPIEYLPGGVPVNKHSADATLQEEAALAGSSMPGFYCVTCRVLSTNQSAYLDHLNSKKHQQALGHSMKVARVSLSEVQQRLHDIEDESMRAASARDKELKDALAEKWRLEEEAEREAKRLKKLLKKQQRTGKAGAETTSKTPCADQPFASEQDDWQAAMRASGLHFSSFGSTK